jgi:flagellar biosynthetic protein FliO
MWLVVGNISSSPANISSAGDFTILFIKMLVVLVVVCVVAVVLLRYAAPRLKFLDKGLGGRYIEVVARHFIGRKKALYIVKVGSRYILIGDSEHGINFISDLDKGDVEGASYDKRAEG